MASRVRGIAAPLLLLFAVLGGPHLVDPLLRADGAGDTPQVDSRSRWEPAPAVVPRSSGRAPRLACIGEGPGGAVRCGLAPLRTGVDGEAYELLTVTGERLMVTLPLSLGPQGEVVAIQDLPVGWIGEPADPKLWLTTEPPVEAVTRSCALPCRPAAMRRSLLVNGAVLTEWRLAPDRPRERLVTVRMGVWTAAIEGVAPRIAEFAAAGLAWSLQDGFLVLDGADPTYPLYRDWAGVRIDVPTAAGGYSLTVTPGCRLSGKRPDLSRPDVGPDLRPRTVGGIPGGEWCAGGRYWVRARNLAGARLGALHERLEVRRGSPVPGGATDTLVDRLPAG